MVTRCYAYPKQKQHNKINFIKQRRLKTMKAMTLSDAKQKTFEKGAKVVRNSLLALNTVMLYANITAMRVYAFGENVTVTASGDADAGALMGKIIGIMLTITRFAGVGLVLFGIYEIVMSFMQQQPEAKTKGIIMAMSGIVMIALKSILSGIGIIG